MTTKFYLASDLHLSFGPLEIPNTDNVDCLILAGDIIEIDTLKKDGTCTKNGVREFFEQVNRDYKHVIWVFGNHEYYGNYYMEKSRDDARNWLTHNGFHNIQVRENQSTEVNGIPIHCCTLWTDMNNNNEHCAYTIQIGMNDYRYIRGANPGRAGAKINTKEIQIIHQRSLMYLDKATEDGRNCIVVTHHQPTLRALNSNYPSNLDYAYASDLSDFFLDRPNIKVWCSGHTHDSHQQLDIGDQRFLTNCRGYYGHEEIARHFTPMLFEMEN